MIRVESFCKAYQSDTGDHEIAVNNLTFNVPAGQVLGLIGPNGAGKTTTMRAIAGIIPGSSGRLSVNDFCVAKDPIQLKRCTAYVPDDPQLFNDLTVVQHFQFVASAWQLKDWQVDMNQLLEQFDLQNKRNSPAADLSRGMRQKLALGCACLYRPTALLLDEPMTGLDPRGIRVLKKLIQQRAEQGAAVVVSSHLLAMVEDICTSVLILERGEKNFHGTIDELRIKFQANSNDATLEDIFFRAVESDAEPSSEPNVGSTAIPLPIVDMTDSHPIHGQRR